MCDDDGVMVYVPISNNSLNPPNENVISQRNENKYIQAGTEKWECAEEFSSSSSSIFLLINSVFF